MKRILLICFVLMSSLISEALAQRTVTGQVTSVAQGEGLPGVTVRVKGTSTGVTTNLDGNYRVSVPEGSNTLIFTFVGYETVEETIGNRSTIDVGLEEDIKQLQEVVVTVPYGTIKKTAFTGSESTITGKTFEKQQVTSFTRALEGNLPGVIATNGGGQPGSNADVRIRGVGSINASSNPLYVVDGVPFTGDLNSISPDDIESLTVLKDAASAALYGARAANGVIMITTKRGRKDKTRVGLNVRYGISDRFIPEYDRVNEAQFMEATWEASRNARVYRGGLSMDEANAATSDGGKDGFIAQLGGYNPYNVPAGELIDPATGKLNPNARLLYSDDWNEALYRTGQRKDINFNVSGGGDNSNYYFSMGYLNEEGIVVHSGFERYNARLNINSNMTDWLTGGVNLSGSLAGQSGYATGSTTTSNPFYYTRAMGPIYPVYQYDENGNVVIDPATGEKALDWGDGAMGSRPYAGNSNLVGSLAMDDRSSKRTNITANAFLEAKFLKNFSFRTTLGTNYYDGFATTYQNSLFGDAQNVSGRSTKSNTRDLTYTFNQVLSWNKDFGGHNVNVLAGHEAYAYERNFVSATRTGFPFPGSSELAPAANLEGGTSYTDLHRIEGYFSQVNYNFNERYMASASIRTDGSSRFSQDARWGQFWSVGGGWRISEENFLQGSRFINEMKLKASYGQSGNEDLLVHNSNPAQSDYYPWQGLYELGWNNNAYPGAIANTIGNPALQWETNTTLNVGVDFTLFNKLEGSVEYFSRNTYDMLFQVPLPGSVGYPAFPDNVGDMVNSGVEVQLGYNAVRTSDFDWRVDLNMTHWKNEITRLPQEEIITGTKMLQVGGSIYDFYLREYAGVDPQTGDALYYADGTDAEGNPTGERITVTDYTQADRYVVGTAIPKLSGGFTNSFRFKNFDLSVLLTYQLGGKFLDSNYAKLMHEGDYGNHWSVDILNRWQQPGDVTDVPRLEAGNNNINITSTRFLTDASWLNVKNISFGYNLPQHAFSKLGFGGSRIFFAADNVHLFSHRRGMDPQRSFNGTSDFSYVPASTYTVGFNLNL